jgi:C1A family cysteine protease
LRKLPGAVDLRQWCSPVEDQRMLGSCTAHAGAGIIEYYERKAFGKHIDASRLFLYKVRRNLMKMKGDRNSWGKGWGEKGYGWLPYEYVLRGLAEDFWAVLKKEWMDTGAFGA